MYVLLKHVQLFFAVQQRTLRGLLASIGDATPVLQFEQTDAPTTAYARPLQTYMVYDSAADSVQSIM